MQAFQQYPDFVLDRMAFARGIDHRRVKHDRVRKSVGAEDTFTRDVEDLGLATSNLKPLADKISNLCVAKEIRSNTVTVKIKYSNFTQATRNKTNALPFGNPDDVLDAAATQLDFDL